MGGVVGLDPFGASLGGVVGLDPFGGVPWVALEGSEALQL